MTASSRPTPVKRLAQVQGWLEGGWQDLRVFPWRNTALTLRERFREDRLGVTAGSLTFTTMISLVPLFTVALAIFSAFPMFARMETLLQKWLVQSLVPENIARQVSNYLLQFSQKAGQMGWLGAVFLLVTALALILTIDRKLNDIWRVRALRPLPQRVLVYWALLTLGPLVLAMSLSLSSYAMSASRGWVGPINQELRWLLDALEFLLLVGAMAAVYRYVPNATVRWRHALLGGLLVALAMEAVRKLLVWYLAKVPAYSIVYGTFATLPILLIWIYLAWVMVLLGAVVVAYLPSLLAGIARRGDGPGWHFQLALELLHQLQQARQGPERGLSVATLAQRLRVDPLQLEAPLEALVALDWVGQLEEKEGEDEDPRCVLLVAPAQAPLAPLVARLLLPDEAGTGLFWQSSRWHDQTLADALPAA
jgi:membrane protein